MLSVIAASTGVLVMLGSWALAWWLWRSADALPLLPAQPPYRRNWQNEPTPDRRTASPPPSWVFDGPPPEQPVEPAGDEPVPIARRHPSSNANTSFFSREELEQLEANSDRTEILDDQHISVLDPPEVDTVKSRKTWVFPGPRRPDGT